MSAWFYTVFCRCSCSARLQRKGAVAASLSGRLSRSSQNARLSPVYYSSHPLTPLGRQLGHLYRTTEGSLLQQSATFSRSASPLPRGSARLLTAIPAPLNELHQCAPHCWPALRRYYSLHGRQQLPLSPRAKA